MTSFFRTSFLAISSIVTLHAAEPVAEAAGIGAWTTDYPAAVKVAAERRLPIFIEFTGSDWCGWCQKMEKECLSKPEFLEAMRTQCVLVSVDFPHKTQLPVELKEQNTKLAAQFKKSAGFPAYYIVDNDASQTTRWSFGAHPKYGADLKLLISDIKDFCAGCSGVVERTAEKLPEAQAAAYRKAAADYAANQLKVVAWLGEDHPDAKAAKEQFESALKQLATLRTAMDAAAAAPASTSQR
ncbi:thioredoxin family protein [Haloferula sp. BvORR071]|uniref:thioredoxin family protein n=1 Tax=Haloferula sp. BvORR071 TaxID=1396141 RepID=UPI0022410325|nr:thioredoxin family protein [Haloferula sp. BvORR071]